MWQSFNSRKLLAPELQTEICGYFWAIPGVFTRLYVSGAL